MDAFQPISPEWTTDAIHARQFCCPRCSVSSLEAKQAWLNRRSPVYGDNYRRKWQEFYLCSCGCAWWSWSSDRPPSQFDPQGHGPPEEDCS
ncbi:MAG: hypothetical protein HC835_16275 [Oscillatoriales cyanobacterium RM2_1_1]|nr:hypothetical protein [Oscillatoriales cyanobacterium SM2_3_0]NJO47044.1 hypothetical protein [Oscillatoriales cyanobacterium RM2_1_1]